MKKALMALAGLAMASLAVAQLSKYKDWANSPEAYFLTTGEREEWSRIKNDEEAEKFIANYWARRDPTPATPQNEFRDAVMRRIAAADEQFKLRRQKGSETARGRLFITLGSPSRLLQSRVQERDDVRPGGTVGEPDTRASAESPFGSAGPGVLIQTWIYEKDKFDPSLGIGQLSVRISVDQQRGSDEFLGASTVDKAVARVAERTIVNPGAAPVSAEAPAGETAGKPASAEAMAGRRGPSGERAAAPLTTGAAPAPAPVPAALPAAVRLALEPLLKEKKEESSPTFWAGAFRSVAGERFFALQFYISGEKAPAGPVKFGGVVRSESGEEVASYWEDAPLSEMKTGSRSDKVFERSVVLPAGGYRGAFALFPAEGEAALVSSTASFRLQPKPRDFEVSPLILANTLTPLTKRPGPTDPFVFGMEKPIRVEPKANRLFTKEDGLWYFYTVSNPAVPEAPPAAAPTPASAEATAGETAGKPGSTPPAAPTAAAPAAPKPRIMTRVGVLKDGQPAFAPFSGPAELQPLAPNYYASGSEIPLATFEPGYYTLTLNVRDLNAAKDSPAYKGVDRKEDFTVLKPDGSMPEKPAPKPAPAKPKAPAKKS